VEFRAGILPAPNGADFCFFMFHSEGILYNYRDYLKGKGQVFLSVYRFSLLLLKSSKFFLALGLVVFFILFAPSIWYSIISPNFSANNARAIANTVAGASSTGTKKEVFTPAFDPSLPTQNKLIIPSIGVDTQINEASKDKYEDALMKGVWIVPDFATPQDQDKPIILAAHRFGYLNWSDLYRFRNSFFNLPKLKEGDIVEIIWNRRKYTYEVYGTAEGNRITDYTSDLILYTCRDLTSSVRIFRYAKLIRT
jgi:sortase (surface protein transpeptidase)